MCADTPRTHARARGEAGPLTGGRKMAAGDPLFDPARPGTTTPGSPRAALPLRASALGNLQRSLIKIKKNKIKRCNLEAPVLETSLETKGATLLKRLAAGGLAASHRLLLWRFPFNGLFAADTSQSGVLGGAGRGEPAAQSAGQGGGGRPSERSGHWLAAWSG